MLKSIKSLFPLIDDPANIFYSGLRNIYSSIIERDIKVVRKTRTTYQFILSLPECSEPYVVDYNILSLSDMLEGESRLLYMEIPVSIQGSDMNETTTSGESIPVHNYKIVFPNVPSLSTCTVTSSSYNKDKVKDPVKIDTGDYPYIQKLIGLVKCTKQGYLFESIKYTSKGITYVPLKIENEDCWSIYRPEIGLKFTFNSNTVQWDLYAIDSNLKEILIDSSSYQESIETMRLFPRNPPYFYGTLRTYNVISGNTISVYLVQDNEDRDFSKKRSDASYWVTTKSTELYKGRIMGAIFKGGDMLNTITDIKGYDISSKLENYFLVILYLTGINPRLLLNSYTLPRPSISTYFNKDLEVSATDESVINDPILYSYDVDLEQHPEFTLKDSDNPSHTGYKVYPVLHSANIQPQPLFDQKRYLFVYIGIMIEGFRTVGLPSVNPDSLFTASKLRSLSYLSQQFKVKFLDSVLD